MSRKLTKIQTSSPELNRVQDSWMAVLNPTFAPVPTQSVAQGSVPTPVLTVEGPQGTGASQTFTTWKTGAALAGYVQISLNGTIYWLPVYSAPTGA